MFRTSSLAAGLIAVLPIALIPVAGLMGAQSQARSARSASVFAGPRSFLGIAGVDVTDEHAKALGLKEPQGVEVTSVTEDSPASKAGIKPGDVILEYNGQHVEGGAQFVRMVQETPAGRKAEMQVWRGGTKQSITATIASRQERALVFELPTTPFPPEPPMIPDTPHETLSWRSTTLGVETEGLNSQLADFFGVKGGVLVRSVTKGSAAEASGLKAGDVITKIDGHDVVSPRNITPFLRKSGQNVSVTLVRNHKELTLNVKLSQNLRRFGDFPGFRPAAREVL